eukprot:jgi/Tetstr1/434505/TSEL_023597.t1
MDDWQVALIWIGADLALWVVLALLLRPKVDKDGDGKISGDELPQFTADAIHPVDGGGLYADTVVTILQTGIEAMAFSAAYGALAVFLCNHVLVGRVHDTVGWLITVWMVFFVCCFMCAFSCNRIHVVTSHVIHFVYYGFAFLPVGLYWRLPAWWLVLAVVIYRLSIHTAVKYYVYPGYPSYQRIVPLYRARNSGGGYELAGRPETADEDYKDGISPTAMCLVYPVYEVVNLHVTSKMGYGILIGCAALWTAGDAGGSPPETCLWIAMGAAGAAMSVLNMREDHFRNGAAELAIGAVIIAHLVHVLGASLLVLSYLAVWHNFGMVKGTSARAK